MRVNKATTASPRGPRPTGRRPTATRYDKDVLLWSQEQARLLRARRFDELDIEHLADEIEDVGKSEKRELASRMAVLLAHLLKWSRQQENRTNSWRATIGRSAQTDCARAQGDAKPEDRHARSGLAGSRLARRGRPGEQGDGTARGRLARLLPVDDGAGGGFGILAGVMRERRLTCPPRRKPSIGCSLRVTPKAGDMRRCHDNNLNLSLSKDGRRDAGPSSGTRLRLRTVKLAAAP